LTDARGDVVNLEAKRLRKLKKKARGLRLSLASMVISDSDRLVVTKMLRSVTAQIQDYQKQLADSRHPFSLLAEIATKATQKAQLAAARPVKGRLVGQKIERGQKRSLARDSELDEWKKPLE
jgi:ribosomal protein L18